MTLIEDMTIKLEDNGKGMAQGTIKINGWDAIKVVEFSEKTTIAELYQKMLKEDFRLW